MFFIAMQLNLSQTCFAWLYRWELVRHVSHGYTGDAKSDMFCMSIQVKLSQICFAWLYRLDIVRHVLHGHTGET